MDINFKHYKTESELQQKLYVLIPLGSSIDELKHFCLKNWIAVTGMFPKSDITLVNSPDIDFDSCVICLAEATSAKFPWSIIPFLSESLWSIIFYFRQDNLVRINVNLVINGL